MSALFLHRASALPTTRAFSTGARTSSFAKMTIVGRLTAQPELKATSTGHEILRYGIAASSGRGENQKTSFFNVTGFVPEGTYRDFMMGLEKGTLVYLEGEASMSYYQDAEGKDRSSLNLVQRQLEVLSPKKRDEPSAPQ